MADFSLFHLTGAYLQLQDKLASDPDADLTDTLDSITDATEVKLDNYQYVIDNFDANSDGLRKQIKRLQDRVHSNETATKRIKASMQAAVEAQGGKVRTDQHTFSLRHSKRLIVDIHAKVPDIYYKPAEVNKKLLGDAVKAGKKFEGVHFEEHVGLGVK